ncbi:acyltransferase family protein [Cognatilysobacter segetis]|uniref:acyltransferase family protein n=1 Tax=Cognatilysobacter segetis TaxID=2492394 RepID=UPI00138FDDD9|nr:acyltransferase family protein [Lysobacter segetis]
MRLRTDLQAMRGFAALIVVLQHASPTLLHAGYLGVDIFFVISGFVITNLIARDMDAGTFRLRDFYFRRAKRLLPAAYATFAATTVASLFFLDMREWHDFGAQLLGAVTYTANFVLLGQTGYFAGEAALKPLLHVWSLSVEEQFYLLLPASLIVTPRKAWLPVMLAVVAASVAFYLVQMQVRPDAAFYLLPTRAWQLGLGVVAALVARMQPVQIIARLLFWPALAALLLVPSAPLGLSAQAAAVAVCLAATVVVLRAHPGADAAAPVRGLARVGDFSYSLYLVHWPIFAFLHNVYAGDPTLGEPSVLVLASATAGAIVGGWLLYRLVELPTRRANFTYSHRVAAGTLLTSLVLAAAPTAISAGISTQGSKGPSDFAWLRRDNLGFGKDCEFYQSFSPIPSCRNAARPDVMVWGDSYAMQLVHAILADRPDLHVLQATKSSCGPYAALAQYPDDFPRAYALNCLSFNRSVVDYLRKTPSVHTLVLSSAYYAYIDPSRHLIDNSNGVPTDRKPTPQIALDRLRETIETARSLGKRVVVVAPVPSTGFDFTHCVERKARGRTWFGRRMDCRIPREAYEANMKPTLDLLAQLEREAKVSVVRFDDALCDESHCATEMQGVMLYRDDGHLSYEGSRLVGRRMHLANKLLAEAR